MVRVVTLAAPRSVVVVDEPDAALGDGAVRVETVYSGISAGTELTQYRGSNPHLHRRWDRGRRLFVDGEPADSYPLSTWGYEEVGRVVEGAGLSPGTVVWGTWGHRGAAVVDAVRAAACVLPDGVAPVAGVFARIGAIALNAVLDADVHAGATVAVFGQGVPGLLATQLVSLHGGRVIAVDAIPRRLELARALGATHALDARGGVAEEIRELTGGRGADVSIEISGRYEALAEAIRATAYNARVVAAGFYQGGATALRLGEEFHHNRITVASSQISGVSPRLGVRWDRERLERAVMQFAAEGRLSLDPLVTHVVPAEDAADAFRLVDEHPEEVVQVVLEF
jgi:2-desacetyl-2-hydroxyethyl bacteriochlorophyllide A dehydrogenase